MSFSISAVIDGDASTVPKITKKAVQHLFTESARARMTPSYARSCGYCIFVWLSGRGEGEGDANWQIATEAAEGDSSKLIEALKLTGSLRLMKKFTPSLTSCSLSASQIPLLSQSRTVEDAEDVYAVLAKRGETINFSDIAIMWSHGDVALLRTFKERLFDGRLTSVPDEAMKGAAQTSADNIKFWESSGIPHSVSTSCFLTALRCGRLDGARYIYRKYSEAWAAAGDKLHSVHAWTSAAASARAVEAVHFLFEFGFEAPKRNPRAIGGVPDEPTAALNVALVAGNWDCADLLLQSMGGSEVDYDGEVIKTIFMRNKKRSDIERYLALMAKHGNSMVDAARALENGFLFVLRRLSPDDLSEDEVAEFIQWWVGEARLPYRLDIDAITNTIRNGYARARIFETLTRKKSERDSAAKSPADAFLAEMKDDGQQSIFLACCESGNVRALDWFCSFFADAPPNTFPHSKMALRIAELSSTTTAGNLRNYASYLVEQMGKVNAELAKASYRHPSTVDMDGPACLAAAAANNHVCILEWYVARNGPTLPRLVPAFGLLPALAKGSIAALEFWSAHTSAVAGPLVPCASSYEVGLALSSGITGGVASTKWLLDESKSRVPTETIRGLLGEAQQPPAAEDEAPAFVTPAEAMGAMARELPADTASRLGKVSVLDWLYSAEGRASMPFVYSHLAIAGAMAENQLEVLGWWAKKKSEDGLELKVSSSLFSGVHRHSCFGGGDSISSIFTLGRLEALKWLKSNISEEVWEALEVPKGSVGAAGEGNHIELLDWWKHESGKPLDPTGGLRYGISQAYIGVMDWWMKRAGFTPTELILACGPSHPHPGGHRPEDEESTSPSRALNQAIDSLLFDIVDRNLYDFLLWWDANGLPVPYCPDAFTIARDFNFGKGVQWFMDHPEHAAGLAAAEKKGDSS